MTKEAEVLADKIYMRGYKDNGLISDAANDIDAFAKQQAIAFMNWTLQAQCQYQCTDENQWTLYESGENITTEQLYDIFLKQQE